MIPKRFINDLFLKVSSLIDKVFFLLFLYMLLRILFVLLNWDIVSKIPLKELFLCSVLGIKVDIVSILLINFMPFFFLLFDRTKIIENITFVIINIPFLILTIIQCEYFKFIGRGLSLNLVNILTDIKEQLLVLFLHYRHISILIILLIILFLKYTYSEKTQKKSYFTFKVTVMFILYFAPNIFSFVEYKSQKTDNVSDFIKTNTIVSIISSRILTKVSKVYLLPDNTMDSLIKRDYSSHRFDHKSKQNIFILVCESLSLECINNKTTYFLDSLCREGVLFNNFYSNGKESIDAVPSIISSVPRFIDSPYIPYVVNNTNIPANLGNSLNKHGYKTLFFHGARDGSMGFKKFVTHCGYQSYFGMDTYPYKSKYYDNAWGIFDKNFLEYACEEISLVKTPFHCFFFTLSAHSPFNLPRDYQSTNREKSLHNSMKYADYSIRNFFNIAKKEAWYPNTLFLITGDHTHFQGQSGSISYKVPLIIYHPDEQEMKNIKNKVNKNKITQHVDLYPTILDYLNIPQNETLPFGETIFANNEGLAFFYNSGKYIIRTSKGDFNYSISDRNNCDEIKYLKSLIQYHNNIFFKKYQ